MAVQAQSDADIQKTKLVIVAEELRQGEEILGRHVKSLLVGAAAIKQ